MSIKSLINQLYALINDNAQLEKKNNKPYSIEILKYTQNYSKLQEYNSSICF